MKTSKVRLLLNSALFLIVLAPAGFSQTGNSFRRDDGQVFDLDAGAVLQTNWSGTLRLPFSFQSTALNTSTGQFAKPVLFTAYTVQPISGLLAAQNQKSIFGGPHVGKKARILDFDPATGTGHALARLPLNTMTVDETWGALADGTNPLTFYWGTALEVVHDGFTPPNAAHQTIQIQAVEPEISLGFVEGKAMVENRPALFYLFARDVKPSDRIFLLTANPPNLFDVPATATLPAGEKFIYLTITPRKPGSGRINAAAQSGLRSVFESNLGGVSGDHITAVPAGGKAPQELQETAPAACIEGTETTPEGRDTMHPIYAETHCGPCKWPGSAATANDCGVGIDAPVGIVDNTHCEVAFVFSNCFISRQTKTLRVRKWIQFGAVPQVCQPYKLLTFGSHTIAEILPKHYCCSFRPTTESTSVDVNVCVTG